MNPNRASFILLGLVILAGSAFADNTWSNYHWERSSGALDMSLGENLSSSWVNHFDVAISDWDQSAVLSVSKKPGNAKNLKRCSHARSSSSAGFSMRLCQRTHCRMFRWGFFSAVASTRPP